MGVKVRATQVNESLAEITSDLANIQALRDELERTSVVLRSQWSGDARDGFATSMSRAQSAFSGLRAVAAQATSEAEAIVEGFSEFDRRRSSAWML